MRKYTEMGKEGRKLVKIKMEAQAGQQEGETLKGLEKQRALVKRKEGRIVKKNRKEDC